MSLIADAMEKSHIIDKTTVPDGVGGKVERLELSHKVLVEVHVYLIELQPYLPVLLILLYII